MNRFSMYAIILVVIGILFFILSGTAVIQNGTEEFTTLRLALFYTLFILAIICFFSSFTLGILGFKKSDENKALKFVGLFFVPIIVIASVSIGLFIAWSAFA